MYDLIDAPDASFRNLKFSPCISIGYGGRAIAWKCSDCSVSTVESRLKHPQSKNSVAHDKAHVKFQKFFFDDFQSLPPSENSLKIFSKGS